jgi:hypothetical protein
MGTPKQAAQTLTDYVVQAIPPSIANHDWRCECDGCRVFKEAIDEASELEADVWNVKAGVTQRE